MKKPIKMVAFDLDGTLLDSEKVFKDRTKEALLRAVEQGITILPATGRPFCGIPKEILEFPGVRYAVTANGASIIDLTKRKRLYEKQVPVETARKILNVFEHYDTLREIYYNGVGFTEEQMLQRSTEFFPHKAMVDYVCTTRKTVPDIRALFEKENKGTDKVQAVFTQVEDKKLALEELGNILDIEITGALDNNIEVNAKGVNKGSALLFLGEHLGIAREEILAFGDGDNDLAMMCEAGCSVCMENGQQRVKDAADYVTLSNDEDGVASFLEQMILT